MPTTLTIGIPTFNRAALLDKQIGWLARAIKGHESECEVIITDNCSTDDTPQVIASWQPAFARTTLRVNRHSTNVGAIRNIAYCIREATSTYVWTIGDDDRIYEHTLSYVLHALKQDPGLALLTLNFSSRWAQTGMIRFERCFTIDDDFAAPTGKALLERCLQQDEGGVACTTAQVYRTDLAHRALADWPEGVSNDGVQIYWTAFCAFHGPMKATKEAYMEITAGTHYFLEDRKLWFTLVYAHIPEVYVRLMNLGYPPPFCRDLVIRQVTKHGLRPLLGALRRRPVTLVTVLAQYFMWLWRAQRGVISARQGKQAIEHAHGSTRGR